MATVPETHRDLLKANVAILTTVGQDGFPQVTAVWFLHDEDDMVRVSINTRRQKLKNLQQHPKCTLFIVDPANSLRTLEIRARAELAPDDAYTFANKLGKKYGVDLRHFDQPGETRVMITLHPVKINAIDLSGE